MLKKIIIILLCFAVHSVESKESVLQKIHKSKYYHRTRPSHKNIANTSAKTPKEEPSENVEKVENEEGNQWTSGYEFIAGHRQGSGVGYNTQYSKFAFYKAFEGQAIQPFIDLRYLILNHGKPGANIGAGVGYQFANDNRLSAYSYFDVTKSRTNYLFNQITAGLSYTHPLEISGKDWGEFTCYFNGYFPMKSKEHNSNSPEFAKFQGNHMLVKRTNRIALTGTNLELGYFSSRWRDFNLYIAGSAYYFNRSHQDAFGGLGKLRIIYNDLINAEVLVSGDRLFGTNVSGTLGIRIPLTPRGMKAVKARKQNLHKSRPIERFEPMVLDKQTTKTVAKDCCGNEIKYLFVNNACHGNCGTFEKPFSTLALAENTSNPGDRIYVFAGDGTTKGMDAGIVMQENQVLAGSGTPLNECTQFGSICVPALTCNRPEITNTGGNGVTLARDNKISGITVKGASSSGFSHELTEGRSKHLFVDCAAINNQLNGFDFFPNPGNNQPFIFESVVLKNCSAYGNVNRGFSYDVFNPKNVDVSIDIYNGIFINNGSTSISFRLKGDTKFIGNINNVISENNSRGLSASSEGEFELNVCNSRFNNNIHNGIFMINNSNVLRALINLCYVSANQNGEDGYELLPNDGMITAHMKNCSANSNTEIGFHSLFNVSALNGRLENCSAKDNGSKSFDFESMNNNIQVTGDMILESAEL